MAVAAILNDPTFWREAREIMLPVARRVFREAYLIGAALGAREFPEGVDFEIRNPAIQLGQMLRVGARAFGDGDYPGVRNHRPEPPEGSPFTPLPFDFDAIRTAAEDAINEYSDEWWQGLSASTQRSMRRTLVQALDEGWTLDRIAREFEPLFGEARAQRIAVAETTTLMGRGAMATYQRAGMEFWIWRTAEDTRVDADCSALARQSDPKKGGTPFPMTRQFNRAHVGCRCWPVPYGPPRDTRPVTEPERQLGEGVQYGQPGWFDTEALYTEEDPQGGRRWQEQRVRDVHDPIVKELTGKARPVRQPTAYMMGGGPASGKSTVIDRGFVKVPENIVAIDPDGIKAMLPEYQRMVALGDARAAGFVHEESSYLSKRVLREAAQDRKNVLLDGTGDSGIDKLAAKVREMRLGGQRVVAQYVSLDTELAVRNATARAIKTGRAVDENVIRNTHRAVTEVFPEAVERGLFDEVTLWDTNINGQPRKVLEAVKDANGAQQVTIHSRQLWSDFLGKANLRPGSFQFELSATYAEEIEAAAHFFANGELTAVGLRAQHFQPVLDIRAEQSALRATLQTTGERFAAATTKTAQKAIEREVNAIYTQLEGISKREKEAVKALREAMTPQAERARPAVTIEAGPGVIVSAPIRQMVENGVREFTRLVPAGTGVDGQRVRIIVSRGRGHYVEGTPGRTPEIHVDPSGGVTRTVVHEMGHWMENMTPELQTVRRAHVAARTQGDALLPLRDLTGRPYPEHEVARRDKFVDPYMGKDYTVYGDGYEPHSEFYSMSLERMYEDPIGFATTDPDSFDFVWNKLHGGRLAR